MSLPSPAVLVWTLALAAAAATPAWAERVVLTSGRSFSVKSVRHDGELVVLALRGGGEIVCDRATVARVDQDEVPYPEPAATPDAGPGASPAQPAATGPSSLVSVPAEYQALVASLAGTHGVDIGLVHAVIAVESAYRPRARSPKGARGLMQLMPATARQYGVRNAYNPTANLEAGIKHLRSLLDRFEVSLALAAYNAGEAAVRRYGGMPPYRETRDYVARVLQLAGVRRGDGAALRSPGP